MSEPDPRSHRERLERELYDRLTSAKAEHVAAFSTCKQVFAELKSSENGLPRMDADGQLAIFMATREEGKALQRYLRALKNFTDLVVHGIEPSVEDSSEEQSK